MINVNKSVPAIMQIKKQLNVPRKFNCQIFRQMILFNTVKSDKTFGLQQIFFSILATAIYDAVVTWWWIIYLNFTAPKRTAVMRFLVWPRVFAIKQEGWKKFMVCGRMQIHIFPERSRLI